MTTTRVTQQTSAAAALAGLQATLARYQATQTKVTTGRAINRPSDSPTGTVSALQLRAQRARADQFDRSATDGLGWLGVADTALGDAADTLRRARDLAAQGANAGSMDQAGRDALAAEVDQLRQGLLTSANATYLGRPVFGGTAGVAQAYDPVTGAYRGDGGQVLRQVGEGTRVAVAVTGPTAFGPPGADAAAVLAQVSADLRAGSTSGLSADLTALDTATTRVVAARTQVGALTNRVTTAQSAAKTAGTDADNALGEVEGIDLPKTLVELQTQQVAYQAALAATGKVLQPSLMDFLR